MLKIDPKYAPLPKDTRAILRQKTLLGETFVELSPGQQVARQRWPTGARSPNSQVEPTVELDEILRIFDPATKRAFRSWVAESAKTISGTAPKDLNSALGNLAGFAEDGAGVLQVLEHAVDGRAAARSRTRASCSARSTSARASCAQLIAELRSHVLGDRSREQARWRTRSGSSRPSSTSRGSRSRGSRRSRMNTRSARQRPEAGRRRPRPDGARPGRAGARPRDVLQQAAAGDPRLEDRPAAGGARSCAARVPVLGGAARVPAGAQPDPVLLELRPGPDRPLPRHRRLGVPLQGRPAARRAAWLRAGAVRRHRTRESIQLQTAAAARRARERLPGSERVQPRGAARRRSRASTASRPAARSRTRRTTASTRSRRASCSRARSTTTASSRTSTRARCGSSPRRAGRTPATRRRTRTARSPELLSARTP